MNNFFKASIIGCGKIAGILDDPRNTNFGFTHASSYFNHKKFSMTSACDHKMENGNQFCVKWGIDNFYNNISEMIELEQPDVVSICTPSEFHYEHLITVLTSKNPPRVVFLEKPVCSNKIEFEEALNILKNSKCTVLVDHLRRFCPGYNKLRDILTLGELGEFLQGTISYYGDWIHNGCHIIDTIRMLFDSDIKVTSVSQKYFNNGKKLFLNVDLLLNKNPLKIRVYDDNIFQLHECDFILTKGRIKILDFGSEIIIQKVVTNNWNEKVLEPIKESPVKGLDSPIYHAVDKISNYLSGKSNLHSTGTLFLQTEPTMDILWDAKTQLLNEDITHDN